MSDDSIYIMTPFDQYLTTESLQMTKLLIPFLPSQSQRMMAVYVKFLEFQHTFSYFKAMHHSSSTEDVLNTIKPFLSPSDMESFEQLQSMMSMMSMMQEMDLDPMSMMNDMFTDENHTKQQKEGDSLD